MISCDSFRTHFEAGTGEARFLEHLRSCDRCLDFAAHADPDVMFRALGVGERIPPGGVDAFVGDVMQQVRVREAETTIAAARVVAWPRRLAMAAAVAATILATTIVYRLETRSVDLSPVQRAAIRTQAAPHPLTTKPVVASYESQNATIVEMPTDGDDVQIVMIFDENLPADL